MLGFPYRPVRSAHSTILIVGRHAASGGLNVAGATFHEAVPKHITKGHMTKGMSRMTTLQGAL